MKRFLTCCLLLQLPAAGLWAQSAQPSSVTHLLAAPPVPGTAVQAVQPVAPVGLVAARVHVEPVRPVAAPSPQHTAAQPVASPEMRTLAGQMPLCAPPSGAKKGASATPETATPQPVKAHLPLQGPPVPPAP